MRIVGIDPRKQQLIIKSHDGAKEAQIDLRLPVKEVQRRFYEAYSDLDDRDRYTASLEILVDAHVLRALPDCLSFLVPSRADLESHVGDGVA